MLDIQFSKDQWKGSNLRQFECLKYLSAFTFKIIDETNRNVTRVHNIVQKYLV